MAFLSSHFRSYPLHQIPELPGIALACFLIILAQSAATSRAYALRYEEKFDENVDLVGLGLSNVAAGMSGTFVVNGSPTKTEMVDSAGGKTQLAQVVTAFIILLVLLFLTVPLSYLPNAVLAAIVFTIGIRLIDINGMKTILYHRPVEFMVALLTALTVIFISVGWGIVIAITLSIIAHLRHSYHPINVLLSQSPQGEWRPVPLASGEQAVPGFAIYQFGANMYYANESRVTQDILGIVKNARPPLKWLCLSASMISDIGRTRLAEERLYRAEDRMRHVVERRLEGSRERLGRLGAQLDALSPLRVLGRGYAVARDEAGRVLRRREDFPEGLGFRLRVTDGDVPARVEGT